MSVGNGGHIYCCKKHLPITEDQFAKVSCEESLSLWLVKELRCFVLFASNCLLLLRAVGANILDFETIPYPRNSSTQLCWEGSPLRYLKDIPYKTIVHIVEQLVNAGRVMSYIKENTYLMVEGRFMYE